MTTNEKVTLARDVEASVVPIGTKVTLQKGEEVFITQSLGGSYTVIVRGNMFRIESKDADALGVEAAAKPASRDPGHPATPEELEKEIWAAMRTCYDPEIPVNIVDLGLIYDCKVSPLADRSSNQADIKMTLTAPGCGMGPVLAQDVQNKILSIEGIDEANVELVWDPPWNPQMISPEGKERLGLD